MTQQTRPSEPVPVSLRRILDLRHIPPGVVPRQLQRWVLIGVALVMVAILMLSGPAPRPTTTASTSPATVVVDPNQRRIEEYQRRIQEQAQRLSAEQAQLELAKASLDVQSVAQPTSVGASLRSTPQTVSSPSDDDTVPARASEPRALDRDDRDERARFADNVAYSRPVNAQTLPALPTLGAAPAIPPAAALPAVPAPSAAASGAPRYRLFEGTVIETVLTNRLDATINGPVNCLVSTPVYAADRLVIPSGARVLGEARAVNTFGQTRVAITFHRLIQPNGESMSLEHYLGLNQAGDLGLHDQVNRHYAQIFGVSLALGAIAGFAQGQSSVGLDATTLDAYRQGVGANVSQSGSRILERFLNVLPTVTIREGHRVKVYLSQDLELPTYEPLSAASRGRS